MAIFARSYVSPDEIYPGRVVTYPELSTLAAELNRTEALKFLGFLNLLLSSATIESGLTNRVEPVRDVQAWVLREILSDNLVRELQAKFKNDSLLDRPILHRTQLLFAIRLVATHGREVGGNMLTLRGERDAIGELLFLTNGLFQPVPATSKAAEALWVATDIAAMFETENPPTVELTWPRMDEILNRRLPEVAADRVELERLEQVALFTTGFSLQAWIDLNFMFFSFWAAVKFRDLVADPSRGYLDPNRPHEVISTEALGRAVAGLAATFDELPALLRIPAFSRETLFDLTPFRKKPLWLMPNGLVMCLDAALLTERLGPHTFWSVMNDLDTSERRKTFTSIWGLAFEGYVLDRLQEVFRGKKWSFSRNPLNDVNNEEVWDGLATRGDAAIAIECKGTFIRSADKYSGIPGHFLRGLSDKFGAVKHGGVYQLVRGISGIWFQKTIKCPSLKPSEITDVFPVLVVQDPVFGCGPVTRVLSDRFQVALERAKKDVTHKAPKIWPLTVVTADDLDRISDAIQSTGQRLDSLRGVNYYCRQI